MAELSINRCTPRTAKRFVSKILSKGLVPFLQSSPGLGKSSIAKQVAKEFDLKVIDARLSGMAPEDMNGLPRFNDAGFAEYSPFEGMFPLEDSKLPVDANGNEMEGWLILLDEFNSATKLVLAASYKLILDREVGQKKLHPKVAIMAAGNLATDRAIVNPIGSALRSRVVQLVMEVDSNDWLYDVAIPERYDSRVQAFLSAYPRKLMDFDPKSQDETYCCPR